MLDKFFGFENYFASVYFIVTTGIALVLALAHVWSIDRAERKEEERGG